MGGDGESRVAKLHPAQRVASGVRQCPLNRNSVMYFSKLTLCWVKSLVGRVRQFVWSFVVFSPDVMWYKAHRVLVSMGQPAYGLGCPARSFRSPAAPRLARLVAEFVWGAARRCPPSTSDSWVGSSKRSDAGCPFQAVQGDLGTIPLFPLPSRCGSRPDLLFRFLCLFARAGRHSVVRGAVELNVLHRSFPPAQHPP